MRRIGKVITKHGSAYTYTIPNPACAICGAVMWGNIPPLSVAVCADCAPPEGPKDNMPECVKVLNRQALKLEGRGDDHQETPSED